LHCQAGAGIVAGSDEENEMQEYNKLRALNAALDLAERRFKIREGEPNL
jgi:anthranilate synthase component 1